MKFVILERAYPESAKVGRILSGREIDLDNEKEMSPSEHRQAASLLNVRMALAANQAEKILKLSRDLKNKTPKQREAAFVKYEKIQFLLRQLEVAYEDHKRRGIEKLEKLGLAGQTLGLGNKETSR